MALTKKQKQVVLQGYIDVLKDAKNTVLVLQKWIGVNQSNQLRKNLVSTQTKAIVVRKRLFLRAMDELWMAQSDLWKVDWTIIAVSSMGEDEFAWLKEVHLMNKSFKKAWKKLQYEYLGWWYEKERKDAAYVSELATLPSKEELIGKFLFLLKYPIQSFTATLDQIRQKHETEGGTTSDA